MISFADVPDSYPNADAIRRIAEAGLIGGVLKNGQRYFEPERAVSRRELAIILDRMNVAELLQGYPFGAQAPADAPADDHA